MIRKIRVFLGVIAASMLITSASAAEVKNTKYDFITELFTVMGIVDEQFQSVNKPDSLISADVFNEALALFFKYDDVKVRGGDRIISTDEALLAFSKGLGSSAPITPESKPEYKKYITPIQEEELLDDVVFKTKEGLCAEDFIQLLFNAMYIEPVMGLDGKGELIYGTSYATLYEIERYKGIVEENSVASLWASTSLGENQIKLSGKTLFKGETNINEYIGNEAEVFVIEDTIIAARVTEKNTEIVLTWQDIADIEENRISYYEKEKTKRISLSDDYIQLYNGTLRLKKDLSILKNDLCRIRLLSNDGDKEVDVIFIEDLKAYQVGSINAEKKLITDKAGNWNEDFSDMNCAVSDGEMQLDFSDIKIGNVIYVGIDIPRSNAIIYVGTETVTGNCTQVISGENPECVIDDTAYPVSSEVLSELRSGYEGRFYLGAFGRIEFVQTMDVDYYGLLHTVYYDEAKDSYCIKVLTEAGDNADFELSKNARFYMDGVDGGKLNNEILNKLDSYISNSMTKNQSSYGYGMAAPIVLYREIDGVVKSLSLPTLYDDEKYGSKRDYYALQSATALTDFLYTQGENLYLNSTGGFYPSYRNSKYNDGAQKFVDANTIVFNITTGEDGILTKDSFKNASVTPGNKSDYTASWIYANFYNLDDDNVAEVMVKYDSGKELTNYATNLTIVESVGKMINTRGEECYRIMGFTDGKAVEYCVKSDAEIYTNFLTGFLQTVPTLTLDDLGKGDLLSLAKDNDGDVSYIAVMYLGSVDKSDYNRYHNTGNCESGREVMLGTIVGLSGNSMILQLDTNANTPNVKRFCIRNYKSADIYRIEERGVSVGTSADLLIGENVYVRLYHSIPMEIIVR